MSTECINRANRYFTQNTKKVYIERRTKIESFEEYLNHRYRDNCYYYSAYALMGLNFDDFLVRGYIDRNYHHGWIEFKFEENEYIFDSMIKTVIPKQEWYESFNPRIDYKKTQKEILDTYLNERCAFKIKDGFWQFKSIVMNTDKTDISYNELIANDESNGYVPSALILARVVMYYSRITRFIAYSDSSD